MKYKQFRNIITVLLFLLVFGLCSAAVWAEATEVPEEIPEPVIPESYLETPVVTITNRASDGKPWLEWEAVDGAASYDIYRALQKDGPYEKWFTTTKTSFINTSTESGVTYYYQVQAVSADPAIGNSPLSKYVYRKCDLPRPKLTVSNRSSDGKPYLKWNKIEGASSYVIYRATGSGAYKKWYTTSKTSVVNISATTGVLYKYKIKAIHETYSAANSAFSKTVSRRCDLPQPTIKVYTRLSDAKPKVTWEKVKGASSYVVYRATTKDGTYKKRYTTTGTSYTNTSAVPGKRYYYKVKAIYKKNSAANSAFSSIKSCKCGQPYIVSSTDSKYTYKNFKSDMDQLLEKYPAYLTKKYLGKTADKRNLYYLVLGNPDADKQIFVTAGFHAREYINCQVTMRLIEYYCRTYHSGTYEGVSYADLFDEVSIFIMPMVNPDGIEISAYGPNGIDNTTLRNKIKKMDRVGTYSKWKANARGVDLNRNYKMYAGWPEEKTYASEGYPGPKRYSEKETQAVLEAMDDCNKIKAVINYHSMGNAIYWGYHSQKYKSACWSFVKLFQDMTGYYLINESNTSATYGDFEHYIMHEYKIPYVCIENGKTTVPVPISEFAQIYKKNKLGFAKAAYHFQ